LVKPPAEVNGFVRTVIETVDPAFEPVAKLRRFVVKRVQVVGAPILDGRRSSAKPGNSGRRSPRRSPRTGAPK
jgi:hypothetical protein